MDIDIPKVEDVGSKGWEKLEKNSVISVTVDDLNEGLIVVSYSHQDNLYQGVLLQLNRERGIPSGISFPKDYCTGTVVEPVGENDPSQVPPLPQRHTYFQEKDPTLSDPIKFRALRRVIKPPARFKNSRMSLRLRHRPVLCAKCRNLCEEKNPQPRSSSVEKTINEDQESKKAASPVQGGGALGSRRSKSVESNPADNKKSETEHEEDYSFVSIGTKSCVENYWKRPKPSPEDAKKGAVGVSNGSKESAKVPRLVSTRTTPIETRSTNNNNNNNNSSCNNSSSSDTKEGNGASLSTKLLTNKTGKANSSAKKSKNIKLCITRITNSCVSKVNDIPDNVEEKPPAISSEPEESTSIRESRNGKRNTTVPVRFRDHGYVTKKNVFSFKRRRRDDTPPEEIETADDDDTEMPDLTSRLSPVETNDAMDEGDTLHPPKLSKSSPELVCHSEENFSACAEAVAADHVQQTKLATSTEPVKTLISPSATELTAKAPLSSTSSAAEPAKTPVIKISFGTPGNGVVIQIPPKAKQDDFVAPSSSSISADKAVRKAMKKAKKEARRKLSLSREPSPVRDLVVSPVTVLPTLHPLLEDDCDKVEAVEIPEPSVVPELPTTIAESSVPIKKKKKEKKKKREKDIKENGALANRENSHLYNNTVLDNERISPITATSTTDSSSSSSNISILEPIIPPLTLSVGDSRSIPVTTEKSSSTPVVKLPPPPPQPQRLCISLKRLNQNSMGWDINNRNNNGLHHSADNDDELNDTDSDMGQSSPAHMLEPSDFPATDDALAEDQANNASSLDSFTDQRRNHVYKKGDIVWGKLPGCPWWPGKILDILFVSVDDVSARVSWYRASTLSCIRFSQLSPFAEQFEARYTRSRKRGSYQHAVRDALIEAHQLDPQDLPSD